MEDALAYAQRQSQLWDGPIYVEPIDGSDDALESARESWAVALGEWLKGTTLFRRLLMIFRQAEHDREGAPEERPDATATRRWRLLGQPFGAAWHFQKI